MDRTLLVTGSTGLLGHAVLARLANQYCCIGLDAEPAFDPVDGVLDQPADLRDPTRIAEIVREHRVTDVVHAGAVSHPMLLADAPATVVATNVHGTENVLEAARLTGVKRLVFLSPAEMPLMVAAKA